MSVRNKTKKDNSTQNIKKSRYWLYFGLAFLFVFGLGAGIGTFDFSNILDSIFGVIDWMAASILYFFYGGVIGMLIDLYKERKNKEKVPEWFYYTLGFIALSIIAITLAVSIENLSDIWYCIYFPFHYGVFFLSISYTLISLDSLIGIVLAKLILDLILLVLFSYFIIIRVKKINGKASKKEEKMSKIILLVIFLFLLMGMIKTVFLLG